MDITGSFINYSQEDGWLRNCLCGSAPPFGGITRIRFKGFVNDVSALRLPRTLITTEDKTRCI